MGVVEIVVATAPAPPPGAEAARAMAHGEVGVEDDAIDAVIDASQQIAIASSQVIRHSATL